ncbi:MAG: MBL fold metallo-hydrolase [Coriobacteriales bacterium]|jgi:L-ascorbate metabolism protein UlaG (beta-lactamase superfamily)|nr:MBL fold metallo-hydrolase [Coriobacteriales bacterium]
MTTRLLYQGHGSYRITAADGRIIFIDPYVGEGYDKPADILLVTHQHDDHNKVELVTQKPGCIVITNVEALAGGVHNTFDFDGIVIEAVEAANANHDPSLCVGFMLTVDGIKLYFASDTSLLEAMESYASRKLDYAFLPIDGVYNMNAKEAGECARLIGARVNVPVHMKPGELFDAEVAATFDAPGKLVVPPGEEIEL